MKPFLLTLAFSFLTLTLSGEVENWIVQSRHANGRVKVDLLNQIAAHFAHEPYNYNSQTHEAQPRLSIAYAQKALDLAQELNYQDGIAVAYHFLGQAHKLEGNLVLAEEYLVKWFKARKQQSNSQKLRWAYFGMTHFYTSLGYHDKTEKAYNNFLKFERRRGNTEGEYRAFFAILDYFESQQEYQNIALLQKAAKYHELFVEFQKKHPFYNHLMKYGADNELGHLDYFFRQQILENLERNNPQWTKKIAEQWLTSQSKFVDNLELHYSCRVLARYCEDAQEYALMHHFLDKSIVYIHKGGKSHEIERAYYNACFLAQLSSDYVLGMKHVFNLYPYLELTDNKFISALNTCLNPILKSGSPNLANQAFIAIATWKNQLDPIRDKRAYDWSIASMGMLEWRIR